MTDEIKIGKSINLELRRNAIEMAWNEIYPPPQPIAIPDSIGPSGPWVVEYFDDAIIVYENDKYYRASIIVKGESVEIAPRSEWVEVESKTEWAATVKSIKTGNRNNTDDRRRIRAIRAKAKEIHDTTMELEPDDEDKPEVNPTEDDRHMLSLDETVVAFGGEIKFLGETDKGVHVGGYLVRFSDEATPDLTGDYFTKDTDFGMDEGETQSLPVYFNHGQPMKTREGGTITITRKIGKGSITLDDQGLLMDAILYNRDEYDQAIAKKVKSLGWSSGALSHLVEREYKSDAPVSWIKRWIIGEGSLTPTPAEPRNSAVPLKSLMEIPTKAEQPEGEPEGAGNAPASEGEAVKAVISTPVIQPIKEENPMEITPEIQTLIDGSVKTALAAFADKLPTNGNGNVVVTKDEADQPWKSLGEFYMSVKNAALSPRDMDRRLYATKAPTGIGELLPTDGGFLVPPQYASGIMEKMYSTGNILSRVARDPISGNRMIYNSVDESSRADGSRQGGVLGYWVAEANAITASKPKFRQVDLKLNKVAALCYATDEILGDVNTLGSWLGRVAPEELRFRVEDAIVEGNGVGKPQGILNANALTTVLRNELLLVASADIVNMWARRWSQYKDYIWLANQEVMAQLNSLVLANSYDANARWASFGPDGVMSIFGRPVIECEYCSALGTVGDIVLMSPSQYQLIDNGGVQAASSIHVNFTSDESVFRFVYRVDGAPLWASALTPFKGSGTLSPYVTLATATA